MVVLEPLVLPELLVSVPVVLLELQELAGLLGLLELLGQLA
jgi:hypothetical protein